MLKRTLLIALPLSFAIVVEAPALHTGTTEESATRPTVMRTTQDAPFYCAPNRPFGLLKTGARLCLSA